jgi:RNA polymerase sigma-70 factor (ECF subfamily)
VNLKQQSQIFKNWIDLHKGIIFKILYAYSSNKQDREDLFQEITLQLWNSIPKFCNRSKETTWIYRVALNTALHWSRNEKKRISSLIPLDKKHFIIKSTDNNLVEDLEWLYSEIRLLGKVDRSLILLYLEGVSYQECSEILGISYSNVGVKINRIKHKLSQRSEVNNHEI